MHVRSYLLALPLWLTILGPLSQETLAAGAYEGRAPDAPWRERAARRIERIRMGDMKVAVTRADGSPIAGAEITVRMRRHAFGFGSAVTARMLAREDEDGQHYRAVVEANYNKVVFENDLKWRPWEVAGTNTHRAFRRTWTDQALAWLNRRRIEVRGHYIAWAPLKPNETQRYQNRPEALRKELFAHMQEKVPLLGKRISEWDAVNHIVGWGTTLSTLLGGDQIYADIIKRSRKLAPHAELWINEGQILPSGRRGDAYERMARYLTANGAAPDGIGFMGHFSLRSLTPPEDLLAVFDRFAKLAPKLQITEFDVDVGRNDRLQADYLRDVITIAFSHPALEAVLMWGFWEGRHWKPNAALYRRDWSVKPAGRVWRELVFDKWWTQRKGKTDSEGVFRTKGFFGEYEISLVHNGVPKAVNASHLRDGTTVEMRP